jgi:hypothetical protein
MKTSVLSGRQTHMPITNNMPTRLAQCERFFSETVHCFPGRNHRTSDDMSCHENMLGF